MENLVSVIVPIYNVELYLNRCIDSILKQTYKNFELILVNDGSTDNSLEICRSYSDPRIVVIDQENGGLSHARNTGLLASKGEFVTFLDSDDWVTLDYLEVLLSLINDNNADISICNHLKTYNTYKIENEYSRQQSRILIMDSTNALSNLYTKLAIQMTVAWGKLYRRKLFFQENEIMLFPNGKVHEDEYTTYKLFARSNKIVYTSQKMLYYWQRPDSIMGTKFKLKNKFDLFNALVERKEFFNNKKLYDIEKKCSQDLIKKYINAYVNMNTVERESLKKWIEDYSLKYKLDNLSRGYLVIAYNLRIVFKILINIYKIFKK